MLQGSPQEQLYVFCGKVLGSYLSAVKSQIDAAFKSGLSMEDFVKCACVFMDGMQKMNSLLPHIGLQRSASDIVVQTIRDHARYCNTLLQEKFRSLILDAAKQLRGYTDSEVSANITDIVKTSLAFLHEQTGVILAELHVILDSPLKKAGKYFEHEFPVRSV